MEWCKLYYSLHLHMQEWQSNGRDCCQVSELAPVKSFPACHRFHSTPTVVILTSYPLRLRSRLSFHLHNFHCYKGNSTMKLISICGALKRFRDSCKQRLVPGTQAGERDQVEGVILTIISLHAIISKEPDLRPCHYVNRLFEELVCLATQTLRYSSVSRAR